MKFGVHLAFETLILVLILNVVRLATATQYQIQFYVRLQDFHPRLYITIKLKMDIVIS